ncbi:MAG: arylsulfatase B [Planctomycetota bacterium]|jgi:arylsulfatase B
MNTVASVLIASLAFAPGANAEPTTSTNTQQKNILLLVLDDLGVDSIGAYGVGADLPNTPNIDAVAQQGIRFSNVWSNPVCSPTRSSIQTGRYSFKTGIGYTVTSYSQALSTTEVALPKMLQLAGLNYSTAAFGKWHLGNSTNGGLQSPNLAGYDHYSGALINIHPPQTYFSWRKTVDGVNSPQSGYLTSDTVDDARDWINGAQEPWLAHVAFHSAHSPFHAPPSALHSVDLSDAGGPATNPRPYWKAMVESMDTEIGRLLTSINYDDSDTVLFILGDNGTDQRVIVPPFKPSHGKGTAYEGGVNIPFIVAGAGVAQGAISKGLINTTDIFATVAELAGANYSPLTASAPSSGPSALDSVSIVPYLRMPQLPTIRKFVFTDMFLPTGPGTNPAIIRQGIRGKRYKLMFHAAPNGSFKYFMFDLIQDPFELNNLLKQPTLTNDQFAAFINLYTTTSNLLSTN